MENKNTYYLYQEQKDECKYCGRQIKKGRFDLHKKLVHGAI